MAVGTGLAAYLRGGARHDLPVRHGGRRVLRNPACRSRPCPRPPRRRRPAPPPPPGPIEHGARPPGPDRGRGDPPRPSPACMGVAQAMEGVLDDLTERPDRLPQARRFLSVHLDGLERITERLEAGAAPPERLPALLEDLTRTAGELRERLRREETEALDIQVKVHVRQAARGGLPMSQSVNEAPATEAAVAARTATEKSLQAAMEAPPPAERDPEIERLAQQIDIADPGSMLRFGAGGAEPRHGRRRRHAGRRAQPRGRRSGGDALQPARHAARLRHERPGRQARLLRPGLQPRRRRGRPRLAALRDHQGPGRGGRRPARHPPHPAARGRGEAGAALRRHARMVPRPRRPHRRRRHRAQARGHARRSRP